MTPAPTATHQTALTAVATSATALPQPTTRPARTPVRPGSLETTALPLLVPTATPALAARRGPLQVGVAAHFFYVKKALPLQRANEAGFGWIRQQIHWKDIEGPAGRYHWGELDTIVAAVNRAGLKLLLSVVRAPRFYGGPGMPSDPAPFGRFLAALTKHYAGQVKAIEVWNEQNLAHENGGRVSINDASNYVELLKAAYTSVKAVDPAMLVIAGPPSSTGITDARVAIADIDYYHAMYSYNQGEIGNYMDAQAVHPGGSANPPDTLWPDNPSSARGWTEHPTFYFRHVENVRALMVQYGLANTPIWITEFGWATRNTTPGFEFGNQVSLEQQAEYIVGAIRRTNEQYPWVEAMFLWNLNFAILRSNNGQPLHEQASFAILDGAGRPRPAFLAIQEYLAELRQE